MEKYRCFFITLRLILVLSLCSQSMGLSCYVTSPSSTSDEQSTDCADFFMAPTAAQLENIGNGTAPKIFCFKRGFHKGCAWGHPDFKPKCSGLSDDKFKSITEHLSNPNSSNEVYIYGHGGPFDFTKVCYCDTDHCNDGNKPVGLGLASFMMILLISLFSIAAL